MLDEKLAENDQKIKNDTNDLDESLSQGDDDAKMRLLKRKYLQMIEDFEHQFTGRNTVW